jgi:hypothetical protein
LGTGTLLEKKVDGIGNPESGYSFLPTTTTTIMTTIIMSSPVLQTSRWWWTHLESMGNRAIEARTTAQTVVR